MHTGSKIALIVGLGLVLSACNGSGSGGGQLTGNAACGATGCARDDAAPAAPLVCAGMSGATCPQGYRCVDDPSDSCDPAAGGADCGGICVLGEALPRCGGLADEPCPAGSVCADDPSDTCDGGPAVDCPGVCRPKAVGQCAADEECPQLGVACSICADGSVSCPHSRCDNGQCTVDFKPCPEPQVCGGISGLSCAPGFQCADDPTDECVPDKGGADCRGICVPQEKPLQCKGITGETCPPDLECVDDPNDMCDPQSGGVDCPGVCQPSEGGTCTSDAECPPVRAACSVCPDGTTACPRSVCDNGRCSVVVPTCSTPVSCADDGSGCKPGYVCADDPNDACDPAGGATACPKVCTPDTAPRPCGGFVGATCPEGYSCVDNANDMCDPQSGGADCPGVCEPTPPPQCRADDECARVMAPWSLCPDGSYACPRSQCKEGMCTVVFDACSGPGFCGGIAGFPCPVGFTCIDDPNDSCDPQRGGADCGGLCVRQEEPQRCGGLMGEACPDGYECIDDPRDDCDPAVGADCPGICRAAPSPMCTSDADCPVIGAPCRLCTDGSAACPRSFCDGGQCKAEFQTCKGEP